MIAKANVKIGGVAYQFEFDEKSEMDTLHKIIILSNPREKCICGDQGFDNKYLTTNKDKEANTYINVKCGKCGARSKLGQYKAGGYFWHEYEIYKGKPSSETNLEEPM